LVKDPAIGAEKNSVRNGGIPLGIERDLEGSGVFGGEKEIAAGGMKMLEHAEDARLFIGHVGSDGDVGEVADRIHSKGVFEIGKFIDAGAAPGGPEIDESQFAGGVGPEGFEVVGGSQRDIDSLGIELAESGDALGLLFSPFRGTAEDARVCCRRIFVGEKRLDNVAGVLGFDEFTAIAVVHAAFVAEVAGFVEDENVRRGLRPVGAGD
jgi:hypothetical protein